jgi:hypothetical protein
MPIHAANAAVLRSRSSCRVEPANQSFPTGYGGGGRRYSCGVLGDRREPRWQRVSSPRKQMKTLLCRVSAVLPPALARASLRGFSCALRLVRKLRRKDFSGPAVNAERRRLGSMARSLNGAPLHDGANSKHGDTVMYKNKVTLIGFLGNDAEVRTSQSRSFTTLSMATKSSYKKDQGYVSHTECHRCVVFGALAKFVAQERCTYPAGRRTAQPGVCQQKDRLQAAHLGNSSRFDPEARPGGESRLGGSGARASAPRGSGRIGPSSYRRKLSYRLGFHRCEVPAMSFESDVSCAYEREQTIRFDPDKLRTSLEVIANQLDKRLGERRPCRRVRSICWRFIDTTASRNASR